MSTTDTQHLLADTREEAIAQRTAAWVATEDAGIHRCQRYRLSGSVLWSVWECSEVSGTTRKYIGCDVLTANRVGWSYHSQLEHHGLTYVSCPLEFLDEAPVVSRAWRANVAAYWRGDMELLTSSSRNQRSSAASFREGDRVRYNAGQSSGPAVGMMGFVTRVPGQQSVHPDTLRRTTFVSWDDGTASSVFNMHLTLTETTLPRQA